MLRQMRFAFIFSPLLMSSICALGAEVKIQSSVASPQVQYAIGKLRLVLAEAGKSQPTARTSAEPPMSVKVSAATSDDDGFALTREGTTLLVHGDSARGAMYGVLDIAEQMRLGASLASVHPHRVIPQMKFRAIKFNLPFASYRNGPYLEQHQDTVKDLKFWESFLDMMAENRFNVLTLWSLHPFAYMTVPKDFPEAQSLSNAEMLEFHQLWTQIFRMAKERGIETYIINWNIFVSPAFAKAHNVAAYSERWADYFGDGAMDKIVEDYTRECVTQVIDEYPDLTGLGITVGERMGGMTPEQRRTWFDRTFFAGIAAAHRPIKLIYRAPLSAGTGSGGSTSEENDRRSRENIEAHAKDRNIIGPIYVEFKFNWSHGHSSPDLFIVHGGKLSDAYWNPEPAGYKIVWTVRNEDFLILRWGQPDFVRQFEKSNGAAYTSGALLGSETYIPALDFISSDGPQKTWKYAFERQWLFYAVWGHLLYDASTPDSVFGAMLDRRFGKGLGSDLLAAWKNASDMPLKFASFHQGTWDGDLYTEGFGSWHDFADRSLFDINSFITHPVLDNKHYINIADYVKANQNVAPGVTSPLQLAKELDGECGTAEDIVRNIRKSRTVTPPLDYELTDIEAWCAYGKYFSHKLRAGVALATARATNNPSLQAQAVTELEKGLADWKHLSELESRFNRLPVPEVTKAPFSWDALTPSVERDIQLAEAPLDSTTSTVGK